MDSVMGPALAISVQDAGIEPNDSEREKIFGKFQRQNDKVPLRGIRLEHCRPGL